MAKDNVTLFSFIILLIAIVLFFVFFLVWAFSPKGGFEDEQGIKPQPAPSCEIGLLYTQKYIADIESEAIPIQYCTFAGGFVEAISTKGERIISNSCTIIFHKEKRDE